MEPMAMVNLMSELANRFSLSMYPTTMATITKGRRSDFKGQRWNRVSAGLQDDHHEIRLVKDTDGKHIDPIHCVLIVVPVHSLVAAQQRPGLTAWMLSGDDKKTKTGSWPMMNHHHTRFLFCRGTSNEALSCLPLRAGGHIDILRGQEKNDAQGPCIHLWNWDGEDQDPGEDAGQGVHQGQERKPQQQPQIGGETTLGNRGAPQDILSVPQVATLKGPVSGWGVCLRGWTLPSRTSVDVAAAGLTGAPPHLWVTAAELGRRLPSGRTHSSVLVHSISSVCYQSGEIPPKQRKYGHLTKPVWTLNIYFKYTHVWPWLFYPALFCVSLGPFTQQGLARQRKWV